MKELPRKFQRTSRNISWFSLLPFTLSSYIHRSSQLSFLITNQPTCFASNCTQVQPNENPPFVPSPLFGSVRIWKEMEVQQRCIHGLLLCERECPDLCHHPHRTEETHHGLIDGIWQSKRGARSGCEQLQRCESSDKKSCSHSCHPLACRLSGHEDLSIKDRQ